MRFGLRNQWRRPRPGAQLGGIAHASAHPDAPMESKENVLWGSWFTSWEISDNVTVVTFLSLGPGSPGGRLCNVSMASFVVKLCENTGVADKGSNAFTWECAHLAA